MKARNPAVTEFAAGYVTSHWSSDGNWPPDATTSLTLYPPQACATRERALAISCPSLKIPAVLSSRTPT
jgi:hypothetical protein